MTAAYTSSKLHLHDRTTTLDNITTLCECRAEQLEHIGEAADGVALPLRNPLLTLAPLLVCYEREGLHDNAQLVVGHIS